MLSQDENFVDEHASVGAAISIWFTALITCFRVQKTFIMVEQRYL